MTKTILLGGYDAKSCPEKVRKTYAEEYLGIELDPIPSGDAARMAAGVEFETTIGTLWAKAAGKLFAAVDQCDRTDASKKRREKQTSALLAEPGRIQVIWNARLAPQAKTNRTGEPDALVRVGTNDDGMPVWAPVDVKDHRELEGTRGGRKWPVSQFATPADRVITDIGDGTPQKVDAMQLAHYHRMLEKLGYAGAPIGGVIGRGGHIVWHDLSAPLYRHSELGTISALDYYDHEFAWRLSVAQGALNGESLVGPEWKSECGSCQFRTTCHDELKIELDHITLLPGITPDRAKAHYALGNTTTASLATLDHATARVVDAKLDVPSLIAIARSNAASATVDDIYTDGDAKALKSLGFATAGSVAALDDNTAQYSGIGVWQLADSIDQARVAKVGKVHLARGVQYVKLERTAIEEDIDIEDSNGYVYLIGVRTTGRKSVRTKAGADTKFRNEYNAFVNWDETPEGEARVFAEFWAHVQGMRAYAKAKRYGYRLYHYSKHEPSSFKALAIRHSGRPGVPTLDEVIAFFEHKDIIDMYPTLSTQLVWPTESTGLKELAKWVRFSWRDSDPGGGNSLAWYDEAVAHEEEFIREENRQRLLAYNEDDVAAQCAIRDWLSRLGESRTPGDKLPHVEVLDRRFRRTLRSNPAPRPKRAATADNLVARRRGPSAALATVPKTVRKSRSTKKVAVPTGA